MGENQNSERITKNKIDEAIKALKEQKPKEREDISDREAVRKMRRYIEKLTSEKYGYSYDEVSEMLQGLGINLSGSRIKYLLGEVKKNTRRREKRTASSNTTTTTVNSSKPKESSESANELAVDKAKDVLASTTHSKGKKQ